MLKAAVPNSSYVHFIYGLYIDSEIKLDPVATTIDVNHFDVKIYVKNNLAREHITDVSQYELLTVENGIVFSVPEIACFKISNGNMIEVEPYANADMQDVRLYVLGSCIAAIWYQRGGYVLHGNVIKYHNSAIVVLADSGTGKSTLAAQFFKMGYEVLSDDLCVLDANYNVQPGYGYLKLWQDTIEKLQLDPARGVQIRLQKEKYYWPLGNSFCDRPMPLHSIYVLKANEGDEIRLQRVVGLQKIPVLKRHAYRKGYVANMAPDIQQKFWQNLKHIAATVNINRLVRPSKGCDIEVLAKIILDDADSILKRV